MVSRMGFGDGAVVVEKPPIREMWLNQCPHHMGTTCGDGPLPDCDPDGGPLACVFGAQPTKLTGYVFRMRSRAGTDSAGAS